MIWLFTIRFLSAFASVVFILLGIHFKFQPTKVSKESRVIEYISLQKGSVGFESFTSSPSYGYLNFHLFHISNGREVLSGKAPKLIEVGPYSYRKVTVRENILEENPELISFGKRTSLIFDEENTRRLNCTNRIQTPCSKSDKITFINPVLLLHADKLTSLPQALKDIFLPLLNDGDFALGIKSEDFFITQSVDDILYSGFETKSAIIYEKMNEILQKALGGGQIKAENIVELIRPVRMTAKKFAFLGGKNDSSMNGFYTIQNGRLDKGNIMKIDKWNGLNKLPWWPDVAPTPFGQLSGVGGSCQDIFGTDGSQFAPFLFNKTHLGMFFEELCRSIHLEFNSEIELEELRVHRYVIGKRALSMDSNLCFCRELFSCAQPLSNGSGWNITGCQTCKDGILDVSPCYKAPLFVSEPHFLNTGAEVQEYVQEGLSPSPEKHTTTFDIEPHFGVPLKFHKRIQFNLSLRKTPGVDFLERVKDFILVPIFWMDEEQDWNATRVKELKDIISIPEATEGDDTIHIALSYVLGPIFILIFIVLSFYEKYRMEKLIDSKNLNYNVQVVGYENYQ